MMKSCLMTMVCCYWELQNRNCYCSPKGRPVRVLQQTVSLDKSSYLLVLVIYAAPQHSAAWSFALSLDCRWLLLRLLRHTNSARPPARLSGERSSGRLSAVRRVHFLGVGLSEAIRKFAYPAELF